jgi:hypothetical protein
MALEPHRRSVLNVQDDAVSVISGRPDAFGRYGLGQFQEVAAVRLVQPGQALPHLDSVNPAAGDVPHLLRFAGEERSTGELPEFGGLRRGGDVLLPIFR